MQQESDVLEPAEVVQDEDESEPAFEQPVLQAMYEDPDPKPVAGHESRSEMLAQLAEQLRARWQRFRVVLAGSITRLRTATSSTGDAVARQARTLKEGIKLRVVQARETWERRLREIRRQRAEAAQRAAVLKHERDQKAELAATAIEQERQRQIVALAAAREEERKQQTAVAAVAQQQELQRLQSEKEKLIEEVERLRLEAREQLAALTEAQLQSRPARKAGPIAIQPVLQKVIRLIQRGNGQLRGALAGAGAATLLFLVGLVWANFHAITPLSHSLMNRSVEEQVPFGATTIHGASGATAEPVSVKDSAQQAAPLQSKPHPASRSSQPPKPDSQWHHFQRAANNDGDTTADDVVVRHFGPPKKQPTQTAQQRPAITRYSDE